MTPLLISFFFVSDVRTEWINLSYIQNTKETSYVDK